MYQRVHLGAHVAILQRRTLATLKGFGSRHATKNSSIAVRSAADGVFKTRRAKSQDEFLRHPGDQKDTNERAPRGEISHRQFRYIILRKKLNLPVLRDLGFMDTTCQFSRRGRIRRVYLETR